MRKLGSPKKYEEKIKTKMGNSTGNAYKKNLRRLAKMIKQKKNNVTCGGQKERSIQKVKLTIQLEEINQKVLAKEGRLRRYRQFRQTGYSKTNEKKFYQQLGGDDNKTYQQPDTRETEQFCTKIWQPKNLKKEPSGQTI